MADIRAGDVGTELVVRVVDEAGAAVNVAAASARTIKLRRADGVFASKPAALDTDGADGRIKYVTAAGDLTEGLWEIQGFVTLPGGSWHSEPGFFEVLPNLG